MATNFERYERQMILDGFGSAAQEKLSASSVLVIGAGGLGCPALQYLAAAGVGRIGIVDDDKVALNNLHRQVLYSTSDVGSAKAATAAIKLRMMNPEIEVNAYQVRLENSNALDLIRQYDIVLDGTDNFSTRYLTNDACVLLKKPLIFGAVAQYEGQVTVFNVADEEGQFSNYRDLFPDPPGDDEVPNCAQAGVIGVLPGIIGTMQAAEVIKLVTGTGRTLAGRLLTFNVQTNQFYELSFKPSAHTQTLVPADEAAFLSKNYGSVCALAPAQVQEIDATELKTLHGRPSTLVIDVREMHERPSINFTHTKMPMSVFDGSLRDIDADNIILVCQHGIRSLYAAEILQENNSAKTVYSLKGGISRWAPELGLI